VTALLKGVSPMVKIFEKRPSLLVEGGKNEKK